MLMTIALTLCCISTAQAQHYRILQRDVFQPQHKRVLLIGDATNRKSMILFQTPLRVNTDGAPTSYHPFDLPGRVKALNNICNAISVRSVPAGIKQPCGKAMEVFSQYRDNDWTVPDGYKIKWNNVIAARMTNRQAVPCVFSAGEYQGYFGSLTSLKNDLPVSEQGECEVNNQLDQRFVPALVMASGANPVSLFGAKVGDLLVAYNPATGSVMAAIIGDIGPEDNLGEGSIALNMALLGIDRQPANYGEAKRLDTGRQEMLLAIIPGSNSYQPQRPYTKENIAERVRNWQRDAGFETQARFIDAIKRFQSALR